MNTSGICRKAIALALFLGAALIGVGSAWWVLKKAPWMTTSVTVGAWKSNLRAGSVDADMYTRASIALNALLALGRDETMYFVATHDDTGRPLKSHCSYRVEGTPPQARWWSITAYAQDLFLFDAPNRQFSLNGTTAVLNANGKFVVTTGPQASSEGFWLPTPGQTNVMLTLRLYNPLPSLQASPSSLIAPSVRAMGVCA
jgi:hypothetical protein